MSSVTFTGVSKTYGHAVALDRLDLEIKAGEFVALLGPSGSGKTTTLNLLAGLSDADEGEIRIGERIVNDVSPDKRDVAMVFQSYALYPHLTVFENLEFPLIARHHRITAAVIEERVGRVAGMLGLSELLHRYPKELSGGQQQRVSLGRAMIREPKVFLLDEPLSNLDARLRVRMRRDIKALHKAVESTIVYVTHDQAEAMGLADRIAVFCDGRLQQYASPMDIYSRPSNRFVAAFIGEREPAMLRGRIAVDGVRLRLDGPDSALSVAASDAPHLLHLDGREVDMCLRAEAIKPRRSGDNAAVATVCDIENAGAEEIIYVRLVEGAELACRAEVGGGFRVGEAVGLMITGSRVLAFDPDSGKALAR